MRCRVAGCKNMSRGPRFGYICDKHRKQLSAKEQREAREKWNALPASIAPRPMQDVGTILGSETRPVERTTSRRDAT